MKENICRPEKKTKGRHVGVTGYWGYRIATATQEVNYRNEMQFVDDGLPVSSSEPPEPLSGPPTLPHYAPIYVPEAPVPDSHYRRALSPENPSVSSYVPDRDDAGPSLRPSMSPSLSHETASEMDVSEMGMDEDQMCREAYDMHLDMLEDHARKRNKGSRYGKHSEHR